jgi:hypothetical protein
VSGRGLDLAQEAFGFIESLDDLQTGRAVLAAMDRAFALFGFENFRLIDPLTINISISICTCA